MAQIRHMDDGQDPEEQVVDELKPGTKLLQGQYTIERFINAGGFGITYLAKNSLDRDVVIKECFPGTFCRRTQNMVNARSRAHEQQFAQIVKLFVQEAKSLSRLVHPNIVGVHQVFEDNDTAYMAIDFVNGHDLLEIIEKKRETLTPSRIVTIVKKLLGAIAFIHDNGMLHRDISPDNILISDTGEPILIDFGAARQQATKIGGKALSALRVVKDGYSPQEFYVSGSVQNASSDLYALAATFHHAITGAPPPDSQTRLVAIAEGSDDPYKPLAGRFDEYPDAFLEALDTAVRVLPRDRIANAREWLERITTKPELKVVPLKSADGSARSASSTQAGVGAGGNSGIPGAAGIPDGLAATDGGPHAARASGARKALMLTAAGLVAVAIGAGVFLKGSGAVQSDTGVVTEAGTEAAAPAVQEPPVEQGPSEAVPATEEAAIAVPSVTDVAETDVSAEIAPGSTAVIPEAEATPAMTPAATQAIETTPAQVPQVIGSVPDIEPLDPEEPVAAQIELAASEVADPGSVAPENAARAEPFVFSEPEAAIDTGPSSDPSVLRRQIESAVWEIRLPFKTSHATAGASFPQVTEVFSIEGSLPENAWVTEGAIIYAVKGTWVTDEASILALLREGADFAADRIISAPARIKAQTGAPFLEVTLAAAAEKRLNLANGVELAVTSVDGQWRTEVRKVAEDMDGGLRAGDVLVTEKQTGMDLTANDRVFEAMLGKISTAQWPQALFSVIRSGEITAAAMPLARGE